MPYPHVRRAHLQPCGVQQQVGGAVQLLEGAAADVAAAASAVPLAAQQRHEGAPGGGLGRRVARRANGLQVAQEGIELFVP